MDNKIFKFYIEYGMFIDVKHVHVERGRTILDCFKKVDEKFFRCNLRRVTRPVYGGEIVIDFLNDFGETFGNIDKFKKLIQNNRKSKLFKYI